MCSVWVVAVGAEVRVVVDAGVVRLALEVGLMLGQVAVVAVASNISLVRIVSLRGESVSTMSVMVVNAVLDNFTVHELIMLA